MVADSFDLPADRAEQWIAPLVVLHVESAPRPRGREVIYFDGLAQSESALSAWMSDLSGK